MPEVLSIFWRTRSTHQPTGGLSIILPCHPSEGWGRWAGGEAGVTSEEIEVDDNQAGACQLLVFVKTSRKRGLLKENVKN